MTRQTRLAISLSVTAGVVIPLVAAGLTCAVGWLRGPRVGGLAGVDLGDVYYDMVEYALKHPRAGASSAA
jgi:hypothetical protein